VNVQGGFEDSSQLRVTGERKRTYTYRRDRQAPLNSIDNPAAVANQASTRMTKSVDCHCNYLRPGGVDVARSETGDLWGQIAE